MAVDAFNRLLRNEADDMYLAEAAVDMMRDGRLCVMEDEQQQQDPHIICTLGFWDGVQDTANGPTTP